jgi:hypothetical protein
VFAGTVQGPRAEPLHESSTHTVYVRMGLPPPTTGGSQRNVNPVLRRTSTGTHNSTNNTVSDMRATMQWRIPNLSE